MTLLIEMLADAHERELLREVRDRRLRDVAIGCRRLLLGFLPIGQRCNPQTC